MHYTYSAPLTPGTLLRRYKRFIADIELPGGEVVTAHTANTGSMAGCSEPGSPVRLSYHDDPKRKLKWSWEQTFSGDGWIGVNTALPNRIVEAAILDGVVPGLSSKLPLRREVKYAERSRIDLLLGDESTGLVYVEVKNATQRIGDAAAFPDAVTARGLKHLRDLHAMTREGHRAAIVFHVGRTDCERVVPDDAVDPAYGAALREVTADGVEAIAVQTLFDERGAHVQRILPVDLNA